MEPTSGLEPLTCRLRISESGDSPQQFAGLDSAFTDWIWAPLLKRWTPTSILLLSR